MDEPTAALDPEAEAEVYTKFNDIVEDKTAIYISHRLPGSVGRDGAARVRPLGRRAPARALRAVGIVAEQPPERLGKTAQGRCLTPAVVHHRHDGVGRPVYLDGAVIRREGILRFPPVIGTGSFPGPPERLRGATARDSS